MNINEREYILNLIICGYIKYKQFQIRHPSPQIRLNSCEVYNKCVVKGRKKGLMSEADMLQFMYKHGLWTSEDDKILEIGPKHIEHFKKDLYNNYASSQVDTIRKYLREVTKVHNETMIKRHSWDYLTVEGVANFAKWQYIIENCTYYKGKKWKWEKDSCYHALNFYYNSLLSDEQIREVSHTSPFDGMWSATKNIFGKPGYKLTLDQQKLLNWARTYESIYKSPECPNKTILNDHDMLDGWLIIQREKREQEERENTAKNLSSNAKINNADEVFIMADKMKPSDVYELNSGLGKHIIKSRINQIKQAGGELKEQELTDIKQKLSMQQTELLRGHYAGV